MPWICVKVVCAMLRCCMGLCDVVISLFESYEVRKSLLVAAVNHCTTQLSPLTFYCVVSSWVEKSPSNRRRLCRTSLTYFLVSGDMLCLFVCLFVCFSIHSLLQSCYFDLLGWVTGAVVSLLTDWKHRESADPWFTPAAEWKVFKSLPVSFTVHTRLESIRPIHALIWSGAVKRAPKPDRHLILGA